MKKKIISIGLIICMTLSSIMLTGCNKKSSKTEVEEPFKVLDECKNATPFSGVVQIDDIVTNVNLSQTIGELVAKIKDSKDKDLYGLSEYNEKMLVAPSSYGEFILYKNSVDYVKIHYWNRSNKTKVLADCYLSGIGIIDNNADNYWLGGGLNLKYSNFTWENVEEELRKYGFEMGNASNGNEMCYPCAVYQDTSRDNIFEYNLEITYDKKYNLNDEGSINNNQQESQSDTQQESTEENEGATVNGYMNGNDEYFQYSHYILTFDKNTQECIGVSYQGFGTKNISNM